MSAPILALDHVSKNYQRRLSGDTLRAVQNVSLTIEAAQIVALVGASGAGKSTLARLALGLEQPDSGQLFFDGVDLGELSRLGLRRVRQQMHLILQDPYQSLHPGMRVAQLVAEPLVIAGVARGSQAGRVAEALEIVGLDPPADFLSRYPHQLSGGQRQRVALARAVVVRPKLVIADEPTSMLDVSLQETILALIENLRAEFQIAFLFITHDLGLASEISDRIAVMHQGQLVEVGPTANVIDNPQHEYTQTLLAASRQFE